MPLAVYSIDLAIDIPLYSEVPRWRASGLAPQSMAAAARLLALQERFAALKLECQEELGDPTPATVRPGETGSMTRSVQQLQEDQGEEEEEEEGWEDEWSEADFNEEPAAPQPEQPPTDPEVPPVPVPFVEAEQPQHQHSAELELMPQPKPEPATQPQEDPPPQPLGLADFTTKVLEFFEDHDPAQAAPSAIPRLNTVLAAMAKRDPAGWHSHWHRCQLNAPFPLSCRNTLQLRG